MTSNQTPPGLWVGQAFLLFWAIAVGFNSSAAGGVDD